MRNTQEHRSETETFEKRLRAYAAGAGAAAAGLLAFSPPAAAEIVVVPAHTSIGSNDKFLIEIEGTNEFTLNDVRGFGRYSAAGYLAATAATGAGVVGHGGNNPQAAALAWGQVIGAADQFEAGRQGLASATVDYPFYSRYGGPFANTTNRYLGLKFQLNGQVHYGWAAFSRVNARDGAVSAWFTAYAYETTPNTPIYAGQSSDEGASDNPRESRLLPANGSASNTAKLQPASLGVLALGSLGLNVWRKRETVIQESS
jgi:hypothetical protein